MSDAAARNESIRDEERKDPYEGMAFAEAEAAAASEGMALLSKENPSEQDVNEGRTMLDAEASQNVLAVRNELEGTIGHLEGKFGLPVRPEERGAVENIARQAQVIEVDFKNKTSRIVETAPPEARQEAPAALPDIADLSAEELLDEEKRLKKEWERLMPIMDAENLVNAERNKKLVKEAFKTGIAPDFGPSEVTDQLNANFARMQKVQGAMDRAKKRVQMGLPPTKADAPKPPDGSDEIIITEAPREEWDKPAALPPQPTMAEIPAGDEWAQLRAAEGVSIGELDMTEDEKLAKRRQEEGIALPPVGADAVAALEKVPDDTRKVLSAEASAWAEIPPPPAVTAKTVVTERHQVAAAPPPPDKPPGTPDKPPKKPEKPASKEEAEKAKRDKALWEIGALNSTAGKQKFIARQLGAEAATAWRAGKDKQAVQRGEDLVAARLKALRSIADGKGDRTEKAAAAPVLKAEAPAAAEKVEYDTVQALENDIPGVVEELTKGADKAMLLKKFDNGRFGNREFRKEFLNDLTAAGLMENAEATRFLESGKKLTNFLKKVREQIEKLP